MGKFIMYSTKESHYNGKFGGDVGWPAAGMGCLFVTDGGKLIALDGGHENDAQPFLELIEKYSDTVDLWIITHPHDDHYSALKTISESKELAERIKIKQLLYFFPLDFGNFRKGVVGTLKYENELMERIAAVFNAEIVCPYRNMRIQLDSFEIHFLYVPDDCSIINTAGGNANYCSLIFSVKGKSKKVMITGDAYNRTLLTTAWRYAEALKCDCLQLPHHGLCDTGNYEFYKYADAKVLFVPISKAGERAMRELPSTDSNRRANLWAEKHAEKVYRAFDGTAELLI